MTVDPDTPSEIQTSPSDAERPTSHNAGQGLTREQFEAAMRVMDARSTPRPLDPTANPSERVSPASA